MENKLCLRPSREQDLDTILDCERRFEAFVGQWSPKKHLQAMEDPDCCHAVFEDGAGQFLGYTILRGLDNPNHSVELMRIAVDAPGKGWGGAALESLKDYVFHVLEANRLWLDVREHNTRAQRAYERAGFRREGLLRQAVLVGGAYQSLVVMALLREEFGLG